MGRLPAALGILLGFSLLTNAVLLLRSREKIEPPSPGIPKTEIKEPPVPASVPDPAPERELAALRGRVGELERERDLLGKQLQERNDQPAAQPPAEPVAGRLEKRITAVFEFRPAREVVETLGREYGLEFVIDSSVRGKLSLPFSAVVHDATIPEVMLLLGRACGLQVECLDEKIWLKPGKK